MSNLFSNSFDRRARRALGNHVASAARAALPQRCELCVAPAGGALLCGACAAALPRLPASCPQCALPSPGGGAATVPGGGAATVLGGGAATVLGGGAATVLGGGAATVLGGGAATVLGGEVCGACLSAAPPYAATVAALVYAFPVDRLLQHLKYGGRLALADWAASTLLDALAPAFHARAADDLPDRVVALPLAPARQRERGFNQAREIATRVACQLDLPLVAALRRTSAGPAQASLRWADRAANVRGAFEAACEVRDARIAIVDDVMTTGATLADAARALTRAGAARVECWVVARTLRGPAA